MRKFRKSLRCGQKGLTLIELLIVMVIVGILGAVIALNVTGFLGAGELQAANTEAHQVRIAVKAHMVHKDLATYTGEVGPTDPSDDCDAYLDGGEAILKADYSINTSQACIITDADATLVTGGWSDAIEWNTGECAWVKVEAEE